MIKRHKPLIAITIMLIIATLACNLGRQKDIPLGEAYQSDVGGYIIQTVPDYEFEEAFGMVLMMPTDGDPDIGPTIMVYGGLIDENKSSQDILDEMQSQASELQFSSPRGTRIDGMDGLLVDLSGDYLGQAINGKLFVVAPRPMQEFYMTVISPEARWKEIEPIYDAVLKSVKFIDAQPFEFGLDDWDVEDPFVDAEEDWDEPIGEVFTDSQFLGEVYHHLEGSFSVRKIAGYDFADDFGVIQMAEPGLDSYAGPLFIITYDSVEGPLTNEELFAMALEAPDSENLNYHTPSPYVLEGLEGLTADFDGTESGQAVQGRVFFVMLTPYQFFSVYGIAPTAEWSEVLPMYEAVLASVEFSGEVAGPPSTPG